MITWNLGCEQAGYCFDADYFMPFRCGDEFRLPFIDGDIHLIDATTGTDLGQINSTVDESSYQVSFEITNIQPTSAIKFAFVCDCVRTCSSVVKRQDYASDEDFIAGVGSAINAVMGDYYDVQDNTLTIGFDDFDDCFCKSIVTTNTEFVDGESTCSLPDINEGCNIPIMIMNTINNCNNEQNCLEIMQLQGVDICLKSNQPICITAQTTVLTFPEEVVLNSCYYLQLTTGRDTYCSQPFKLVTDDCFYPLVRAKNNNEAYTVVRLGLHLRRRQVVKDLNISKDGNKKIKKVSVSRELVYEVITDHYPKEVHLFISDLFDKETLEIYGVWQIYGQNNWQKFVNTEEYTIEYIETPLEVDVAQAKTKLTVSDYVYTKNNCY